MDVRGEPIQPGDNTAGQDRPGRVCAGQPLTGLPPYVRRGDTPRITWEAAAPIAATFRVTSLAWIRQTEQGRTPGTQALPDTLSHLGIAGGAVYDALVALAAKEHGAALATRDARARGTYDAVGVAVIVVT